MFQSTNYYGILQGGKVSPHLFFFFSFFFNMESTTFFLVLKVIIITFLRPLFPGIFTSPCNVAQSLSNRNNCPHFCFITKVPHRRQYHLMETINGNGSLRHTFGNTTPILSVCYLASGHWAKPLLPQTFTFSSMSYKLFLRVFGEASNQILHKEMINCVITFLLFCRFVHYFCKKTDW